MPTLDAIYVTFSVLKHGKSTNGHLADTASNEIYCWNVPKFINSKCKVIDGTIFRWLWFIYLIFVRNNVYLMTKSTLFFHFSFLFLLSHSTEISEAPKLRTTTKKNVEWNRFSASSSNLYSFSLFVVSTLQLWLIIILAYVRQLIFVSLKITLKDRNDSALENDIWFIGSYSISIHFEIASSSFFAFSWFFCTFICCFALLLDDWVTTKSTIEMQSEHATTSGHKNELLLSFRIFRVAIKRWLIQENIWTQ